MVVGGADKIIERPIPLDLNNVPQVRLSATSTFATRGFRFVSSYVCQCGGRYPVSPRAFVRLEYLGFRALLSGVPVPIPQCDSTIKSTQF